MTRRVGRPPIVRVLTPEQTAARNALVVAHLDLAPSLLRWINRRHPMTRMLDRDDALSITFLAMLRAAEDYDPEVGSFFTYACSWVRNYLSREAQKVPMIHASEHAFRKGCKNFRRVSMLRCPAVGAEEGKQDIDEEELAAALAGLKPRSRQVLTLSYGLGGTAPLPLTEIARTLGVSRQRVCVMKGKAVRHLRTLLRPWETAGGVTTCATTT